MSKTVLGQSKSVGVLEYNPPKIELGTPAAAKEYLEHKAKKSSSFKMSEVIRVQTGVAKIEMQDLDAQIEEKVLERLKQIQEPAYQEAYQLGLEEGKADAYKKATTDIEARLTNLDELINSIVSLKNILVEQNESHLVQLAFQMAKRLAFTEVTTNPDVVVKSIKESIQLAQAEEEVSVHVNPQQVEFLESLKLQNQRDMDFLKKVKLVPSDSVSLGGCIIETNYGEIDARFEQRVSRLWEALAENLTKIKPQIGSDTK